MMSIKPVVTAICFSLALFLLLFMVWPKYQTLQDVNQKVKQAQAQLQKNKEYVSKLETLSGRLDQRQQAMDKVETALPSKAGLPNLLHFLHDVSSNQGLLLKDVGEISEASSQGKIKRINVNLSLIGSYPSFKNFVRAVEKSSRIVEVKNISFRVPEPKEGESRPSRFEVKLSTHYYSP